MAKTKHVMCQLLQAKGLCGVCPTINIGTLQGSHVSLVAEHEDILGTTGSDGGSALQSFLKASIHRGAGDAAEPPDLSGCLLHISRPAFECSRSGLITFLESSLLALLRCQLYATQFRSMACCSMSFETNAPCASD